MVKSGFLYQNLFCSHRAAWFPHLFFFVVAPYSVCTGITRSCTIPLSVVTPFLTLRLLCNYPVLRRFFFPAGLLPLYGNGRCAQLLPRERGNSACPLAKPFYLLPAGWGSPLGGRSHKPRPSNFFIVRVSILEISFSNRNQNLIRNHWLNCISNRNRNLIFASPSILGNGST